MKKILQTVQLSISRNQESCIRKIEVVKEAELIGCTLHSISGVSISFAFLEPFSSTFDDMETSEKEWRRYLILTDGGMMPYLHYRHITSLCVSIVGGQDSVFGERYVPFELHVFEITHPQKVGEDCQEPCEWDDEDE